jgi:general secretion pathway protein G
LDAYKRACDEGHIATGPLDSGYPASLKALVDGVPDAMSASPRKIFFLRRVPSDPLAPDGADADDGGWGIRRPCR